MTSVFSSIPWAPSSRGSQKAAVAGPPTAVEDADLTELNTCLQTLVELFPEIQPEVFREMLNTFDGTSRLQIITEALLKNAPKWVQGRYRTSRDEEMKCEYKYLYKSPAKTESRGRPLESDEKFRTEGYKAAVKDALYQEFKGLNRSTIRGVLAEYNYSYTQARPTLLALISKSWRYSITNFFTRRKQPAMEDNPHLRWHVPVNKTLPPVPRLVSTRNWELDRELHDTLIAPILAEQQRQQIQGDRDLAEQINEQQAEEADEIYDCECCFVPRTMQQMSACDGEGHYICFFCIRHTVNEAIYGQGWARSVVIDRGSLRCLAPGVHDCTGCVPMASIRVALESSSDGPEIYRKFQERCSAEVLLKTKLPLIRCPFCAYAEVDEIQLSNPPMPIKFKNRPLLAFMTISLLNVFSLLVAKFIFLWLFFFAALNYLLPRPIPLLSPISASLIRLARKRRGLKFTCLSSSCSRSSCMSCSAEWHDIHICHESSLTSLRTYIERAMADAVKRTCPICNISFVKSSGCNKLTCVCGYTMCYVCRKELGAEGYAHFCQHFRQDPGKACTECDKCDLYKTEDEEMVVKRAKVAAEKEWLEREGKQDVKLAWELDAGPSNGFSWELGRKLLMHEFWEKWLDRSLDAVLA